MIGMVVAALPAAAQEASEPITWLIDVTVKPGKFKELEAASLKYDKPVLDALVANGSISSYGLACQMVGPPSQSCMYWVTAAGLPAAVSSPGPVIWSAWDCRCQGRRCYATHGELR